MVLAGLRFDELNAILKENGFEIVSNEYWDKHDIVILKKESESITLTVESFYNFPFVVRYLTSLGITVPESCQKPYTQYMEYLKGRK